MAMVWFDGFERYSQTVSSLVSDPIIYGLAADNYTIASPALVSIATGRYSGFCFRMAEGGQIVYNFTALTTFVFGVAFKLSGSSGTGITSPYLIRFVDGSTTHLRINKTSANKIQLLNGSGVTLGTGATTINDDTWYYLELKATISDTGSYTLRINGSTELSSGSADTRNAGNASINNIILGATATTGITYTIDYDDFYLLDTTGSFNNDLLGVVAIEALRPTSFGTYSAWTGSVGNLADTDLDTFIESGASGNKCSTNCNDLTNVNFNIRAVNLIVNARRVDSTSQNIKRLVVNRLGTSESAGSDEAMGTGFVNTNHVFETSPITTNQWTTYDVNTSQFGVQHGT